MPRDSHANGLLCAPMERMASARPGTSRSMTLARGFRCAVARAEAGAAYGEDQMGAVFAEFREGGCDGRLVIGEEGGADFGIGPLLAKKRNHGWACGVLLQALRAAGWSGA
jgi:hypothetical protein